MNTEQQLRERAEAILKWIPHENHEDFDETVYEKSNVIDAMLDFHKQELQRIGEVVYVPVGATEKPEKKRLVSCCLFA